MAEGGGFAQSAACLASRACAPSPRRGCARAALCDDRRNENRRNKGGVMVDLVLKGGRVIDPSQGIDKVADVAFAAGKVVEVGTNLPPGKAEVRDVPGLIVTP